MKKKAFTALLMSAFLITSTSVSAYADLGIQASVTPDVLKIHEEEAIAEYDDMLDDGMLDDGMLDDGMLDDGMLDDGMLDDGMLDDGMLDDGMLDDGMLDDGTAEYATATLSDAALQMDVMPLASFASGNLSCESGSVHWDLSFAGKLTITGDGVPKAYEYEQMPWFRYASSIKSIAAISDTVRPVDMSFWFVNLENLATLDSGFRIPESAVNIAGLFEGCYNLKAYPEGFTIPDSVEDMNSCFMGNQALTGFPSSFRLGENVKDASYAFANCCSVPGFSYSRGITAMPAGFTIPDSVTNITCMFANDNELLSLPAGFKVSDNVTEMWGMFSNCSKLSGLPSDFVIPEGVTYGRMMFYGCNEIQTYPAGLLSKCRLTDTTRMLYTADSTPINLTVYGNFTYDYARSHRTPNINYYIIFNSDGGNVLPPMGASAGAAVGTLPTSTKTGYDLEGWYSDESFTTKIEDTTIMPVDGLELFAKWTPKTYVIDMEENGGSSVSDITVTYDAAVGALPTPSKDGFDFAGWYTTAAFSKQITDSYIYDASYMKLYAKWNLKSYTVNMEENGGNTVSDITAHYGYALGTLPVTSKTGYDFGGWFKNTGLTQQVSDSSVFDDTYTTLYAKWTPKTYTLHMNTEGGSAAADKTVTYGAAIGTLPSPSKNGYTFGGWYQDASMTVPVTESTVYNASSTTLYAKWVNNTYLITMEENNGRDVNDITVTYDKPVGALPVPIRTGYTFAGWFTDNNMTNQVTEQTVYTGDFTTLYAKWTLASSGGSGGGSSSSGGGGGSSSSGGGGGSSSSGSKKSGSGAASVSSSSIYTVLVTDSTKSVNGSIYGMWINDAKGWWFKYSDGTWPAAKWLATVKTVNNVTYTTWYYFNAEGYMLTGWAEIGGKTYYFDTVPATAGAMLTGKKEINGVMYDFSTVNDSTLGMRL